MSLFDRPDKNPKQPSDEELYGIFHPIDDTKKIMTEISTILRDVRKMVDKAARAMKILGEP